MRFRYLKDRVNQHYGYTWQIGEVVDVDDATAKELLTNKYYEVVNDPIDADSNGYIKKEEIKARLDALGIQYPEKATRAELLDLL